MIERRSYGKTTWVDLFSPTDAEVDGILTEFNVPKLLSRELVTPSVKSKVDLYTNCIYLILHFPAIHGKQSHAIKEVDFVIGKDFIITARYDEIFALHKFAKQVETESILEKKSPEDHGGFVFYAMVREMYHALSDELEGLKDSLDRIQDKIFNGEERDMVRELSLASRKLLNFSRATKLHKDVLESFEIAGTKFFGETFEYYLRATMGEYFRVENLIQNNQSILAELRKTNDSLLSTKQNEIMKVLTIMAFVTFPLSLIASIFGMNTTKLPIAGHPNDFWIVILIMAALTGIFFIFFKYKKWL